MGQIVVRFLADKAPKTVENFVALATGTEPSADAEAVHLVEKRFFDGMIFHRTVKGFMIRL
jgi:peptidyl-prolyl cis-trans isomerase A (cyclophilin A)